MENVFHKLHLIAMQAVAFLAISKVSWQNMLHIFFMDKFRVYLIQNRLLKLLLQHLFVIFLQSKHHQVKSFCGHCSIHFFNSAIFDICVKYLQDISVNEDDIWYIYFKSERIFVGKTSQYLQKPIIRLFRILVKIANFFFLSKNSFRLANKTITILTSTNAFLEFDSFFQFVEPVVNLVNLWGFNIPTVRSFVHKNIKFIYSTFVQEIVIINIKLSLMELCLAKLNLISKGAGSSIYTYGQPDHTVVLKMVKCNTKESKHLVNEYAILKQLNHQHIIMPFKFKRQVSTQYLNSMSESEAEETFDLDGQSQKSTSDILVLEHAQKGSLMSLIKQKRLSVPQIRHLFNEACLAVQYLHCNYFVHRDLKLQNIFVAVQNSFLVAKLGDFGFATTCTSEEGLILFNSFKGTKRGYMAPEIHEAFKDSQKFYDARKADVFAMGVVLFALLLGRLPFEYATMQNNLYKLIVQENYEQFWKQHINSLRKLEQRQFSQVQDFKNLFISMVKYDPNSRITIG